MTLLQLFGTPLDRLVPAGIRYGKAVFAANVAGASMDEALARLSDVVSEADATIDNLARVTAFVGSVEDRDPVYGPWDRMFPDPADRPAFKVLVAPLPAGVRVRLDGLALAGARRRRIDIPGVPARDPTVVIGDWMATSRVHGTDPRTESVPSDLEVETRQAFANVAALLELAGRRAQDVSQLLVFVRDVAEAEQVRSTVRDLFPPELVTVVQNFVPRTMRIMVEALAGGGVREVYARPDVTPIPDAVSLGDLLFAPAIEGDGTNFESQLRAALDHMKAVLTSAELTLRDVGQVSVYMRDLDWKPTLNQVWSELFPNPDDRPPHKYVPLDGGDPRRLVQLQVLAVRGAQRRVLEIPGMAHGDPMSMGARLGNLVFSSRIVGTDTSSGKTPSDDDTQARLAFRNARTLVEQAGLTTANLTQVNAFINDDAGQEVTLRSCRELFPDETSGGPRLHFLRARLPGSTVVRLEVIAAC